MTESKVVETKAKGGIKFSGRPVATWFHPLPDQHPCYALVGLIAAEGARIEHALDQSIAYVAGVDLKVGACLTGQMIGPSPRFTALLQLCRERRLPASLLKRIEKVSGHSCDMFERRNRAVHDPWMEEVGTGASH